MTCKGLGSGSSDSAGSGKQLRCLVYNPDFELAALCTRTESRLEELGRKHSVSQLYADYNEMLANPEIDAVSVVTMWDQHTEPAVAALEAGKHVFLEKPWRIRSRTAERSSMPRRGQRGI